MARTVQVADVFLRVRTVRLPAECPHCGADLTVAEALQTGRLDMTYELGSVTGGDIAVAKGDEAQTIDVGRPVSYVDCQACMGEILAIHEKHIEVEPDQGVATLWSTVVDQILVGP